LRISDSLRFVAAMVVVAGVATGCSLFNKPAEEAKAPVPTMGILDMQRAINSHPKYPALLAAQKELEVLAAGIQSQQTQSANKIGSKFPPAINGVRDELVKEFNAKMAAKGSEMKTQLDGFLAKQRRDAQSEQDAYVAELDKDYNPRIFSLQLKQKTVQLTPDQQTAVQAELERLQKERAGKIADKHQELAAKIDAAMADKQVELKGQLDQYGQELSKTMGGRMKTLQAQAASQSSPLTQPTQVISDRQSQLVAKQQEITALEDAIIVDIKQKAAKVAQDKGLTVVLTNIRVNVNAIDITNLVITEIKK
jgi:hypothetical protein